MCGYAENLVAVAAELLHKHAGTVCSRTNPIARKGVQRVEDPFGGVKGQRPLGYSCHTSPERPQPADNIHLPRGFQRGGGQDGGDFAVSAPPCGKQQRVRAELPRKGQVMHAGYHRVSRFAPPRVDEQE